MIKLLKSLFGPQMPNNAIAKRITIKEVSKT